MRYKVLAPVSTRLVPGQIIDGKAVENLDSLIRLGMVEAYVPKKKATTKKKG